MANRRQERHVAAWARAVAIALALAPNFLRYQHFRRADFP